MNISSVDGQPLGPPDLTSYANYPPPHLMDGNDPNRRPRIVPVDHQYSNGQIPQSARQSPGLKRSGSVSDDGNRSRNAKAQRRHREKRKAQLRLLEHKVVELEAQCESLTHKLNQCVSEGRGPVPSMQDFEAIQAENAYLRQENQELRRQFGGRPPYPIGGMPPPPGGANLEEAKSSEGGRFQGDYSHSGSPRGYERVNVDYGHDSGSNPSSSSGFHVDGVPPMSRQHRSRLSLSSGLNSSPYVPTTPAFPDPRHHAVDGRYSSSSAGSGAGTGPYDHPAYPHGPPPHTMPRNGLVYGNGPDSYRENESWNNGPPPFTQVPYGVYPDNQGQGHSHGQGQGQGQGQSSHAYAGTPTHHQTHDFAETPTQYGETPGTTQSKDEF